MPDQAAFLIVDDEQEVCNFFSYLLRQRGYKVTAATSGEAAYKLLKETQFNTALVDLKLPDASGLDILKQIKKIQPACAVIIITGYSTVKSAVEAIQLGAFDYVEKPFVDIEEMEKLLERSLQARAETEELTASQQELGFVIGRSQKMLNLVAAAHKIARKNITVLIQGETGTGKEVLARYIHSVSHRSDRPFLAFNCGAFAETLLESELFGHEKGSFTGATHQKKGIFEQANRATIFLDEIDSASPAIQVKLLRVLETGEFLRVGGEEMCKVDVRIITATNTDLTTKVAENKFREDLFYRLDVASLQIPPLRERHEDLDIFINFFLKNEAASKELPLKQFDRSALDLLKEHRWPGNIRELSNTVAQALLLSKGELITVEDLPARINASNTGIATAFKQSDRSVVEEQLSDQTETGRLLSEPDARGRTVVAPLPEDTEKSGSSGRPPESKYNFQKRFGLLKGEQLLEGLEHFKADLFQQINFRQGFSFEELNEDISCWREELLAEVIKNAIEDTYGNQSKAAELLGITPRALRYHLKKGGDGSQ